MVGVAAFGRHANYAPTGILTAKFQLNAGMLSVGQALGSIRYVFHKLFF